MNIVWFKRDLRIDDHVALATAQSHGPILPLYILEPELWNEPDLSYRHYQFLIDCLTSLDESLKVLGQRLIIKVGNAVDILEKLRKKHSIQALWSHQETWNGWTYTRDKAVKQWARAHHIPWYEPPQNGVIRCLKSRYQWSAQWEKYMQSPRAKRPPLLQNIHEEPDTLPTPESLGLSDDGCLFRQKGGRMAGLKLLHSFLTERGEGYTKEMSSPVTAFKSCSRLSTHLAFGTVSMREVFQITQRQDQRVKNMHPVLKGTWPKAIWSFKARLAWHCHFIQKLEDEPRIEFENLHPAYNHLRNTDFNHEHFNAWKTGHTGYPMIDACMRALIKTGWINFRMRAMLMSFASQHLWLHWRETALHLARLFTDYEPGIHYNQAQMQSGTTGINSIRIYNPIKQNLDQDPRGIFIKKWIPELSAIPEEFVHTPWDCPDKMNGYPLPIVDEKSARKAAADQLYALKKEADHKKIAKKIVTKHASRKSAPIKKSRTKKVVVDSAK